MKTLIISMSLLLCVWVALAPGSMAQADGSSAPNSVLAALEQSAEFEALKHALQAQRNDVHIKLSSAEGSNGWITVNLVQANGDILASETSYVFFLSEHTPITRESLLEFISDVEAMVESTLNDTVQPAGILEI